MSTNMLIRLDLMESMADLLLVLTLWLEVCPVAGFLCRATSCILLLSFRFLCFYLPDANSEALFLSFALHKSACLHRTAIQNP
jgi:hypothetical protein